MSKETENFAQKKKSCGGLVRVWKAFGYSCSGLRTAFRQEHAFRQEIFVMAPLTILVLVSPIDWVFKALMLLPMPIILFVELINSAIETVVDDISTEYREAAKKAKDFGSATVMLAILAGIILWSAIIVHCVKTGQLDAWINRF